MAGVAPKFSPLDVLRALLLLSDHPMSRADVVEGLGLGEGSVRSILDELKDDGLVDSSRQGHALSLAGRKLRDDVLEKVSAPRQVTCDVFQDPFCSAIVIRSPDMGIDPVRLRDVALKWGAEAALVLTRSGGSLKTPMSDKNLDLKDVDAALGPADGDVVVLAFADTRTSSDIAALAVAVRASPWLRGLLARRFAKKTMAPLP